MLKKLRIGFAAIVAILALTATVASHAGVFSKKLAKAAVSQGCYIDLTLVTGEHYVSGQAFPSGTPPTSQVNNSLTLDAPSNRVATPELCDDAEPVLCCVQVNASNTIQAFILGERP